MKKKEKKEVKKSNTDIIAQEINKLNTSNIAKHLKKNLSSYISNAQRIAHYYGNLRIKYVTFNLTFLALFASIVAMLISLIANFNPSLWIIGIPILIGFITYFVIVIIVVLRQYNTISFNHSDLLHYSCFQNMTDFPKITANSNREFTKLFTEQDENVLIMNDLKTLIKQYFHQANHEKIAYKMRKCFKWVS